MTVEEFFSRILPPLLVQQRFLSVGATIRIVVAGPEGGAWDVHFGQGRVGPPDPGASPPTIRTKPDDLLALVSGTMSDEAFIATLGPLPPPNLRPLVRAIGVLARAALPPEPAPPAPSRTVDEVLEGVIPRLHPARTRAERLFQVVGIVLLLAVLIVIALTPFLIKKL